MCVGERGLVVGRGGVLGGGVSVLGCVWESVLGVYRGGGIGVCLGSLWMCGGYGCVGGRCWGRRC